ncbi:hypothetical protein ACF3DV_28505 [Chlorogloeopsis fritschii PCC 9212]|uniref:Glycine zipper domain-containing protein n=1 Tax=Chlorogloeopsis fritschii PCC 6912 TaxID=211165 RepID=A0A3S1FD38_CHLFR|nr:hypothetical protein [Chlorogloeopsis fritschii]RUR75750.1 hypothetical protein PCC6912_46470 [Chlorogloeopsis fritschii PCC 6912]
MSSEGIIKAQSSDIAVKAEVIQVYSQSTSIQLARTSTQKASCLGFFATVANGIGQAISDAASQAGKAVTETTASMAEAINGMAYQAGKTVLETAANVGEVLDSVTPPGLAHLSATANNMGEAIGSVAFLTGKMVSGTTVGIGEAIGNATSQAGQSIAQTVSEAIENIPSPASKATIQEFGGSLIGATVGETVGGTVGAVVAGMAIGPAGAIVGTQVGSVVGFTIGAQFGEDAVRQVNQIAQKNSETVYNVKPSSSHQQKGSWLGNTACNFLGETGTAVIGGAIGVTVLGPKGKEVGRKIGMFVGRRTDWNPNIKTATRVEVGGGEKQQS